VEASTEIQQAARKVVDENKKLRTLLHDNGISDNSIDSFLQLPTTPVGSTSQGPALEENAVRSLDRLLAPRQPSFDDGPVAMIPAYEEHAGKKSIPFSNLTLDTTVESSMLLASTGEDTRRPVPAQQWPGEDQQQLFQQSIVGFAARNDRQDYGLNGVPIGTMEHRSNQLAKDGLSPSPGVWNEAPQVSPTSHVSLQTPPIPPDHTYMNHPVQFSQHQTPSFSTPWSQNLPRDTSTTISVGSDSLIPLMSNGHRESQGYVEVEQEEFQVEGHTYHEAPSQYPARRMQL
jgi:hypothetical protein